MAVYVLLEFADEDQAKTLVEDMFEYTDSDILTPCQENNVHAEVCGIWKKPIRFCQCIKRQGWTRGKKYSWWVCSNCGFPSSVKKASATEWELALGSNLLPAELSPERFKYRLKGWESPMQWNFLLDSDKKDAW